MTCYQHKVAIIANGLLGDQPEIKPLIQQHSLIVAANGGLKHCDRLGIQPHLIVGDCDSTDDTILKKYSDVPLHRFPKDKNETDLELAIAAVYTPEVFKISIFGALGSRTDHSLANLHLIRRYPGKVYIESESEIVFCIANTCVVPCKPGQTISLIQIGDPASGITTEGLKWELQNSSFSKYFMSLSNICLSDSFKVKINEGDLICCMQKNN